MALAQDSCKFLFVESPHHSLTLHSFSLPHSTNYIICDVSLGTPRPVPPAFRKVVFDSLPGLPHTGIRATQKLVSAHFVWPKMYSLIKKWAPSCLPCQHSRIIGHTLSPSLPFLLQTSGSITYMWKLEVLFLLHMVKLIYSPALIGSHVGQNHSLSRMSLLHPSLALSFRVGSHILGYHPRSLLTGQFESDLWAQLMTVLGTTRICTTSITITLTAWWNVSTDN